MYHQFKNRVTVTATLKAETALYVGAGQESFSPMAVQGSLLKNVQNQPYIPGSSLKGVLRSFLESVQDGTGDIKSKDCVCCKKTYIKKEAREAAIKKHGGEEEFAAHIKDESCPACGLFGSEIMAGKLKFADAVLPDLEMKLKTEMRTGNAIDRDTHTTSIGALFETEAIPSGTEFKLRILAENLTKKEAEIFSELLEYFAQGGITVGGRSRAGLGMVSVKDIAVEFAYMEPGRFAPAKCSVPYLAALAASLVEKGAA